VSTVADMKVRAIAPWFGGKRTLAPEIVPELGTHTQYFEPFCGSMAVLFAKQPSQKETVNDLHGDLINLAQVIQDPHSAPLLYERLQRVVVCEGLLDEARDHLDDTSSLSLIMAHKNAADPLSLERAYWYFLASWMGRNGTAGTERVDYQIAVRWTKNGGSPTIRFRNAVESIPAWHYRLGNVVILRRDAFGFIDRFEDVKETAIYIDSPYTPETRNNLGGKNGGGGHYLHEFQHESAGGMFGGKDDHARLAEILRGYRNARIVVSYYDCERIRDLYRGWTFLDKTRQKNLHAQNGRGMRPKDAPEILIINGPSYTQQISPTDSGPSPGSPVTRSSLAVPECNNDREGDEPKSLL
jgi:DNA adenine methylase